MGAAHLLGCLQPGRFLFQVRRQLAEGTGERFPGNPEAKGICLRLTVSVGAVDLQLTFLHELRESTRPQWWESDVSVQCRCRCACCCRIVLSSVSADYFSLLSGSFPSPPLPSPAPSVASSGASSSGSLRHRRPLISPARLNLKGQKLLLFSPPGEVPNSPSSSEERSPPNGSLFIKSSQLPQRNRTRDTKHTMGTCGPEVHAVGADCHGALGRVCVGPKRTVGTAISSQPILEVIWYYGRNVLFTRLPSVALVDSCTLSFCN